MESAAVAAHPLRRKICGFELTSASARAADLTAAESKAMAEEGFIYGLPIVMNYGVMYEYAVDKNLVNTRRRE